MSEANSNLNPRHLIAMGVLVLILVVGLLASRNLTAPAEDSRQRLETAKTAILDYAREKGEIPPDLAAVVTAGYLEAIPEDRSGNPLVFRNLGGRQIEVTLVGPDGKEGGRMFKRDHVITFEVPAP